MDISSWALAKRSTWVCVTRAPDLCAVLCCAVCLWECRQNARESVAGFCPSSALSQEPFSGDTWFRDPQRPRLYDMLTDTERRVYSKYVGPKRRIVAAGSVGLRLTSLSLCDGGVM